MADANLKHCMFWLKCQIPNADVLIMAYFIFSKPGRMSGKLMS